MERMLMEYLVNSLWQAPLLAAGAWLALRAGRPAPRVQHTVWVGALALIVATPLLSLRGAVPEGPVAPALAQSTGAPAQSLGTPSIAPLHHRDEWDANPSPAPPIATQEIAGQPRLTALSAQNPKYAGSMPVQAAVVPRRQRMREFRLSAIATHRIVELYLAVVLFAALRLLSSWFAIRRMVSEAAPAMLSAAESALLDECCERSGVRRPRVLVSACTSSPLVVGVRRPSLLLPDYLTAGSCARELDLKAVLWHELAHVRRRDYLMNLVHRIWALPVAYHPATSWVHSRIRQTREMVCDAIAADAMESSVGYARCLVGLAHGMHLASSLEAEMGVGMFDSGVLEERVMELIGTKAKISGRMRALRLAGGVATMLGVVAAAATFHVTPTLAQAADSVGYPTEAEPSKPSPQTALPPAGREVFVRPVVTVKPVLDVNPMISVRPAIHVKPVIDINPVTDIRPMAEVQAVAPQQPGAPPAVQPPAAAPAGTDRPESRQVLTPEERAKVDKVIADAKQRIQDTVNSPEFKRQIEEARQQALDAAKKLNSPEFQRQLEEAKRQASEVNTPEFRKRMEDARKQIAEVQRQLNGVEFQKEVASELKQNTKALKDLDSPEFRTQIADATRQATEAARQLNSPEFKQQMEEARRQIEAAADQIREAMRSERALDRDKRDQDKEKTAKEKSDHEKTNEKPEQ